MTGPTTPTGRLIAERGYHGISVLPFDIAAIEGEARGPLEARIATLEAALSVARIALRDIAIGSEESATRGVAEDAWLKSEPDPALDQSAPDR